MTAANFSSKIIYADNAATTKFDDDALNLMINLQKNFFANPSSSYKISHPLRKILHESREKIAAVFSHASEKIFACVKILLDTLRENKINFRVNDGENRLPGHLSLSFRNCGGETLMNLLDLKNICVSTGAACNSRQIKIPQT